uniref:Uncharacterized protein n=1 Tax=viral metagenome TaxID=1070528 RepID=A0A6M3KY56_9ZZZZ
MKTTRKRTIKPKTDNNPITPRRVLTPEESALVSRIEAESTDWFGTITEDELNDFSLMSNPMDLMPEAKKLQDEKVYAFRWCTRTAQRADELTRAAQPPLKWAIVNRQTLPNLSHLVDDVLGCVCVLDQMLLFKPWAHHALVQSAKQEMAGVRDKSAGPEGWKNQQREGYKFVGAQSTEDGENPYKVSSSDDVQVVEGLTDDEGGLLVDSGSNDLSDFVDE